MIQHLAIVLAAGKGTRMETDLPKVLVPVGGRPLVDYVLDTVESVGISHTIAVVGYRAELVRQALAHRPGLTFAEQTEQLGTGHAVQCCRPHLREFRGAVLVLTGDSPLTQASSLRQLLDLYDHSQPACIIGTLMKDNPHGMGRIVRNERGEFLQIVEQKDATEQERAIQEVNMSTYVFDCERLLPVLDQLQNNNSQGEFYITDCPGILKAAGEDVRALPVLQPCEALSINNVTDLQAVEAEMCRQQKTKADARIKDFSGRANPALARKICGFLNLSLGKINLGDFPDGEISCKIEEDVRGRDVYLIQSTCPPVNKNLMELLIMIDSCRRASAARITAVLPYFGYARQDRKDEGRVPITAKLVANIITRAGADRALTMDLHAAQIQGFFDVPVDHLYGAPVLNRYFLSMGLTSDEIVVVSPDEGSIKRAVGHAKRIGGTLAIVDKRRSRAERTSQENLIGGPVEGKVALMFDDMISTAGSICGAAALVHRRGARQILVAATHAVLCGPAIERLREAPIDKVVLTDTIPIPAGNLLPKMEILSVAPILGEAIKRIHHDESISEIFRLEGL